MALHRRASALARVTTMAAMALAAGCSTNQNAARNTPSDSPHDAAPAPLPAASAAADAASDAAIPDAASGDAAGRDDGGASAGTHATPAGTTGLDFAAEAKALFHVAACGGDEATPDRLDAAVVAEHCKAMAPLYADYKSKWIDVAMPYLARLVPKGLPPVVVYPFGGGDLLSAIATFPDFTELTTISLEIAGDVRKIGSITNPQLKTELKLNRLHLAKLFDKAHSRTENLDIESKSALPGEIVFTMAALQLHGYEPVSLRYFTFNADGTLAYVDQAAIDAAMEAGKKAHKTKEQIEASIFADMELVFRKRGDAAAPTKTLRHVAFNLDDKHMKGSALLKHLEGKGRVTAMTKAASHFLWSDDFSVIRGYLLEHMEWMISDSTGIPLRLVKPAGFAQDTYGTFEWPEAFGAVNNKDAEALKRLFKENPQHEVTFRYGYPDNKHHGHIVVTRKATASAATP